jgi:hypothetical protein
MGHHVAELCVEVDDGDRVGAMIGEGDGDVDGDRGRPCASLGAEADDQAPFDMGLRRYGGFGCGVAGLRDAQLEGDHARFELAGVERARDHLVDARLDELDALLDVVRLGDREDRQEGQAGLAPDGATKLRGTVSGDRKVHDEDLMVGRDPERLGAVGHERHRVAHSREDGADLLAGG